MLQKFPEVRTGRKTKTRDRANFGRLSLADLNV